MSKKKIISFERTPEITNTILMINYAFELMIKDLLDQHVIGLDNEYFFDEVCDFAQKIIKLNFSKKVIELKENTKYCSLHGWEKEEVKNDE